MKFVIGNFLVAEGAGLNVNIGSRGVTGFPRLQFIDGGTTLEFDATPLATTSPTGVARASTITWGNNDATPIANGIELIDGKRAIVTFHWPNPLTPNGAGLFFRLAVKRTSPPYQLDLNKP